MDVIPDVSPLLISLFPAVLAPRVSRSEPDIVNGASTANREKPIPTCQLTPEPNGGASSPPTSPSELGSIPPLGRLPPRETETLWLIGEPSRKVALLIPPPLSSLG